MKKKILFLVMVLTCAVTVSAQDYNDEFSDIGDNRSSVLKIGPVAGLGFSTMGKYDAADLEQKSGIGFHGGAAVQIHFGRKRGADAGTGPLALQVEALYVQHTVKMSDEDVKLNYFEVPVLLKYFITPNFNIEVGPSICGTLSTSPDYVYDKARIMRIATGEIKGFDVKATVGVSYELKEGFFASARYNLGTSDVAGNFPCKMSAFTLSVGWMFDIFKF